MEDNMLDPELKDALYEAIETTAWGVIEDCIREHGGTVEKQGDILIGYDKYGYYALEIVPDDKDGHNTADIVVYPIEGVCDVLHVVYEEGASRPYWTFGIRCGSSSCKSLD